MNPRPPASEPRLIPPWIQASFRGWLLGFVLVLAGSISLEAVGIEHAQFMVGVGMGAGVGLGQARAAIWLEERWRWALASTLGMGGAFVVFELLVLFGVEFGSLQRMLLSVGCGALLTGLLQARVLRERVRIEGAAWWILASAIGWLAACGVAMSGTTLSELLGAGRWLSFAISLGAILGGGPVLGALTGLALKRLLRAG